MICAAERPASPQPCEPHWNICQPLAFAPQASYGKPAL